MSIRYDIEELIEDRFIDLLDTKLDCYVRSWSDTESSDLSPIVLVNAIEIDQESGTRNSYTGLRLRVDFGVFVDRNRENSRLAGQIRGQIREILCSDDIVSLLNQNDDVHVYRTGVIPIGSAQSEEGNLFRKDESVEVVASINVD